MKNHLKRIASPRTWPINRKSNKFILRPNPGAHSIESGMPLGIILRDFLKLVSSMTEAQKLLNNKEVLVDGKRRKAHRYIVGLFDVISFPAIKKNYRFMMDKKGRLTIIEIDEKEAVMKPCKIMGKKLVAGGKMQFNLHDGKNILGDHKAKVGDSLLLQLPDLAVKEVLVLEKGASVFLIGGNHAGGVGSLNEIKNNEAIYQSNEKLVETAKKYLFVIGGKNSVIKVE
jgi:small subunit ribosomal protein S4e